VRWDNVVRQGNHDPIVPKEEFLRILEDFLRRARNEREREEIQTLAVAMQSPEEPEIPGTARGVA
jgi:hypothetical protein